MSKLAYLIGIIAIMVGFVMYSGILNDTHSVLQIYPEGQQLAPNFRGIEGVFFQNKQKLYIHYRMWHIKSPKALVFCLHGTLDHSGWYEGYAKILNQNGYSVFALDHQGHGLSEGDSGHVQKFSQITDDAIQFINMIKEKYAKESPVFVLSESLGTVAALDMAIKKPKLLDALVVIGTPIDFPNDFPAYLRSAVDVMSKYTPSLKIFPLSLDPSLYFVLQEIQDKWNNDPLVLRGFATPRFISSTFGKIANIRKNFQKITTPIYIAQGDQDIPSQHRGSKLLYDNVKSQTKFLTTYDDLKHYPLQDVPQGSTEPTEIQTDILNFFDTTLMNKDN